MRRFLAGLAVTALLLAPRAAQAAEPVPIAVVDMLKCVKSHPAFRKAQSDFETKAKAADSDRDKGVEDVKALMKNLELEQLKDTPQYQEKRRQLEVRKMQVEFQWKWNANIAQEEYVRTLISIYEQVKGLVAAYARTNRIGLVLQMTDEKLQAKDPTEFTANVVVRSVPYFDPALDITSKVIATYPPASPAPAPSPAPGPGPAPSPAPASSPGPR
jgi:Skp family chaperone for outer membrane proteins